MKSPLPAENEADADFRSGGKPETADRELALWFSQDELVSYPRDVDRWILE